MRPSMLPKTKKQDTEEKIAKFIDEAPDAQPGKKTKRTKKPVTFTVLPEDLEKFDAYCKELGMSRSELLSYLMVRAYLKHMTREELFTI